MGHSKRYQQINQNDTFKDKVPQEIQREIIDNFEAREAINVVDNFCSFVLPLSPDGPSKLPLYYGAKYGGQFLYETNENGIETAVAKLGLRMGTNQFIDYGSEIMSEKVTDKILGEGGNSSTSRFVESSLSYAFNEIYSEGKDRL